MRVKFTSFFKRINSNYLLFPLFLFFIFSFTTEPTLENIKQRMQKVRDADFKQTINTDDAIKIVTKCYLDSKKINYEIGVLDGGIFLTVLYANKQDFANSIKIANEIENLMEKSTFYRNKAEFYRTRGSNYMLIGLIKDAKKDFLKALTIAELISDNDDKHYMKSVMYLDLCSLYENGVNRNINSAIAYNKKALLEAEKISKNGQLANTDVLNDWLIVLNYYFGNLYLDSDISTKLDLAKEPFENARKIYEDPYTKMLLGNEIAFLAYLCKFYTAENNYNDAIKFGLKSLDLQKKENFPQYKKIVYENIAKAYLKTGENDNYQKYIDRYIYISDSLNLAEKKKAIVSLDNVNTKKEQDNSRKNRLMLNISLGAIVIFGLCFFLFWKHRNKKIHSDYLTIIEKLKSEKLIETKNTKLNLEDTVTTFSISEETYNTILSKINKFEKNLGFIKNDITLSYLSNKLKTNPRSLSLVIKSSKDKNFNTYINDLRINYIIYKLYENRQYRGFKISYLAEECGFSSPKVFVTAFKKLTGVTPSYYITNLKKDLDLY